MFSLRIHSLDSSLSSPEQISSSSSAAATATSISPSTSTSTSSTAGPSTSTSPATAVVSSSDPLDAATASTISASQRIQIVKGIAHLYRSSPPPSYASIASSSSASNSLASPDSLLPAWRGKLLFVVAVPYVLSPEDFVWVCDSYIQLASKINFIRNDGMEDRYSVLLEFEDQLTADRFYRELNGWKFPSSDVGEVCHVLYLVSAEYTNSLDFASTPPIGSTELPTCPICIERLDQDTSGIINTSCDHSFQCPCVSKWVNSSCPVCHLYQNISAKPTCSVCMTNENLWICIICGFVGCGRYKEGHAFKHWKNTNHCYSLDLETHRVWDYVGDNYVHRLNHSKIENKNKNKNKLFNNAKGAESGHSCASDDSEFNTAVYNSKVDLIVDEYNALLASQLETQRLYYEGLLLEAKNQKDQKGYFNKLVDKGVNIKLHEIQQKFENINKENKKLAIMNDELAKNQNIWREKVKEIENREKETSKLKDEMIHDLEEQIRDFTVCIEAQKTIGKVTGGGEIKGGTLLPVLEPPPAKNKKSLRANKRRN